MEQRDVTGTQIAQHPGFSGKQKATLEGSRVRVPAGMRGPMKPEDRIKLAIVAVAQEFGWDEPQAPADAQLQADDKGVVLYPLAVHQARERTIRGMIRHAEQEGRPTAELMQMLNYLLVRFTETNIQAGWRVELGRMLGEWGVPEKSEVYAVGRGDYILLVTPGVAAMLEAELGRPDVVQHATRFLFNL